MIGERIGPVLIEIEQTLLEFETNSNMRPGYSNEHFRASLKIFMSALIDKMWELQQDETIDMQIRMDMAQKAGEELRNLIKTYTNIDCHTLYQKQ